MPAPPLSPAHRTVVKVLLGAWVVVLAILLLEPSGQAPSWLIQTVADLAHDAGVPSALASAGRVGFGLNVVAFAPVSFLAALLWPRPSWRDWTAFGFVASFLVEAVQGLFMGARAATEADVVANTLGALVGSALAAVLVRGARRASEGRADLPDRSSPAQQDQLPG